MVKQRKPSTIWVSPGIIIFFKDTSLLNCHIVVYGGIMDVLLKEIKI